MTVNRCRKCGVFLPQKVTKTVQILKGNMPCHTKDIFVRIYNETLITFLLF